MSIASYFGHNQPIDDIPQRHAGVLGVGKNQPSGNDFQVLKGRGRTNQLFGELIDEGCQQGCINKNCNFFLFIRLILQIH